MRPAVHVDRPIAVWPADVEDVDALELGEIDELHAVRRQQDARDARGLASCVRLQLMGPAVGSQGPRPRLIRDIRQPKRVGDDGAGKPQSLFGWRRPDEDPTARRTRCGTRRAAAPPGTRAVPLLIGLAALGNTNL